MDLGLTGRRAFVAGSSTGIGRAIASALLAEGARVVINGRNPEKLEKTRAELEQQFGVPVSTVAGDVSKSAEAIATVIQARDELGGLDILVCNGGGPPPGTFRTLKEADWRNAVDLLLLSAVNMVRAALPHLEKSNQPRIVLLESTSIKQPIANLILSNTVRSAVGGLARSLARELAPSKILVNVVCPGLTDTNRVQELFSAQASGGVSVEEFRKRREAQLPLGRMAQPEEIANLVAFLCSARASYMTGSLLTVDGGDTLL